MNRDELNLESLNYRGILRELIKNWWMIVLAALSLFLLITGIGKLSYIPQYTTSSTLVVSAEGEDNTYMSLSMANEMANVIKEIFQSDALLKLVRDETGNNSQCSVSCSQISETNLLVLTVTGNNPKDTYAFMTSALKHYDEVSDYVFANASLQILQEPSIPMTPSNLPILSNYRYHLTLLGALAMGVIIIVFYIFRYTLKSSQNASKLLDGKILGTIPYEKKKGNRNIKKSKEALLISSSVISLNFAEANRRVALRLEHHLKRKKQKIILITSVNENEGKSTLAANLTLALTEKNNKVLLIDGDFRKPSQYKIFNKEKNIIIPIEQVLNNKLTIKEAIKHNKRYKFDELFTFHELVDPSNLLNNVFLKKIINDLKSEYDYIVIDCPPTAVATDAEIWMEISDTTVLVVRQDWSDIRVINDTVDLIWQSGSDFSGFVLNSFIEENTRHDVYDYTKYKIGK